jgi:hypothetical protein
MSKYLSKVKAGQRFKIHERSDVLIKVEVHFTGMSNQTYFYNEKTPLIICKLDDLEVLLPKTKTQEIWE